jgi:hypothetical protein
MSAAAPLISASMQKVMTDWNWLTVGLRDRYTTRGGASAGTPSEAAPARITRGGSSSLFSSSIAAVSPSR